MEPSDATSVPVVSLLTTRVLDVVVALALLVVALPVLVVAAAISAVALRTSPLFVQRRVGRNGRPFRLVKIRTLPRSVPAEIDKYHLRDHRVPRATQWLRDLHIDELPQLLSVLTGAMALVGPRPEMPALHAALAPEQARLRTTVAPGCTGLWQISPAAVGLIAEAPEYDRYLIEHRTLRLRAWILARTVVFVVARRPISGLDRVPAWTIRGWPRADAPATAPVLRPSAD